MACDAQLERMHELVDDSLDDAARRDLEIHLEACPACRVLLADLQRIRQVAGVLERRSVPPQLWTRIEGQLHEAKAKRPSPHEFAGRVGTSGSRPALRPYAWLAAAALVLLIAGSAAFVLRNRTNAPRTAEQGPPGSAAGANDLVQSVQSELDLAEQHYDKAIKGLEQIAKAEGSSLDPQLAATLQKNLGVIDQAIAESRAALRSQPESTTAQESLFEALRRKVGLLQDTIALMNEMRKGNQAGAAEIVEGLNKS